MRLGSCDPTLSVRYIGRLGWGTWRVSESASLPGIGARTGGGLNALFGVSHVGKSANQEASALRFVASHPWRKNKSAPRMGQPASRRVGGSGGHWGADRRWIECVVWCFACWQVSESGSQRIEICGIPPLAQKQERAKDGAPGESGGHRGGEFALYFFLEVSE